MVKVTDLKVAALKAELEKRYADTKGLKTVLQHRLLKILEDEGNISGEIDSNNESFSEDKSPKVEEVDQGSLECSKEEEQLNVIETKHDDNEKLAGGDAVELEQSKADSSVAVKEEMAAALPPTSPPTATTEGKCEDSSSAKNTIDDVEVQTSTVVSQCDDGDEKLISKDTMQEEDSTNEGNVQIPQETMEDEEKTLLTNGQSDSSVGESKTVGDENDDNVVVEERATEDNDLVEVAAATTATIDEQDICKAADVVPHFHDKSMETTTVNANDAVDADALGGTTLSSSLQLQEDKTETGGCSMENNEAAACLDKMEVGDDEGSASAIDAEERDGGEQCDNKDVTSQDAEIAHEEVTENGDTYDEDPKIPSVETGDVVEIENDGLDALDFDLESTADLNTKDGKGQLSQKAQDDEASQSNDNNNLESKAGSPALNESESLKDNESDGNQTTKSTDKSEDQADCANLWVSGLPIDIRASGLKALFNEHGKVTGVKVVTSSRSSKSNECYGFISMTTVEEADLCCKKLNRTTFKGHLITVEKRKHCPSAPKKGSDQHARSTSRTNDRRDRPGVAVRRSDSFNRDNARKPHEESNRSTRFPGPPDRSGGERYRSRVINGQSERRPDVRGREGYRRNDDKRDYAERKRPRDQDDHQAGGPRKVVFDNQGSGEVSLRVNVSSTRHQEGDQRRHGSPQQQRRRQISPIGRRPTMTSGRQRSPPTASSRYTAAPMSSRPRIGNEYHHHQPQHHSQHHHQQTRHHDAGASRLPPPPQQRSNRDSDRRPSSHGSRPVPYDVRGGDVRGGDVRGYVRGDGRSDIRGGDLRRMDLEREREKVEREALRREREKLEREKRQFEREQKKVEDDRNAIENQLKKQIMQKLQHDKEVLRLQALSSSRYESSRRDPIKRQYEGSSSSHVNKRPYVEDLLSARSTLPVKRASYGDYDSRTPREDNNQYSSSRPVTNLGVRESRTSDLSDMRPRGSVGSRTATTNNFDIQQRRHDSNATSSFSASAAPSTSFNTDRSIDSRYQRQDSNKVDYSSMQEDRRLGPSSQRTRHNDLIDNHDERKVVPRNRHGSRSPGFHRSAEASTMSRGGADEGDWRREKMRSRDTTRGDDLRKEINRRPDLNEFLTRRNTNNSSGADVRRPSTAHNSRAGISATGGKPIPTQTNLGRNNSNNSSAMSSTNWNNTSWATHQQSGGVKPSYNSTSSTTQSVSRIRP